MAVAAAVTAVIAAAAAMPITSLRDRRCCKGDGEQCRRYYARRKAHHLISVVC
jgi:hypothetical protein